MIRTPTQRSVAYAWWLHQVRHLRAGVTLRSIPIAPVSMDWTTPTSEYSPQPGWYRTRLVRNGPWVPATISLIQVIDDQGCLVEPEYLRADVNGDEVDPWKIWTWLRPIPRDQFDEMIAFIADCRTEDPLNPVLFPHEPVDTKRSVPCPTS